MPMEPGTAPMPEAGELPPGHPPVPGLKPAALSGGAQARVHDDVRAWERPSDHAPVSADFSL